MTKQFKFSTNNSVYNCIVSNSNTDIEFLLPRGIPNQTPYTMKNIKGTDVVLLPADQLRFKVYLTVLTDKAPKVKITCDKDSTVYGADVVIEPNACQLMSFVSSDGGDTWSVVNNVYGKADVNTKLAVLAKTIADEEARAKAAEEANAAAIETETNRALAAEAENGNLINKEISDRKEEDAKLVTRIKALEDAGYQTAADVVKILDDGKYVKDANYVHTDNNYTNTDKEKVNTINLE